MKNFLMLTLGLAAMAAVAEDLAWPSDYDEKVAARETARMAAKTTVDVTIPAALDLRMDVSKTSVYADAIDAVFLELYPTSGIPYDPEARTGLLLWVR